jgi:hypothetical protein
MMPPLLASRHLVPFTSAVNSAALCPHLALWQKCAEQTKNSVVFEDDAAVRHDAKSRLPSLLAQAEDWHIILLGGNTDVPLELKITPSVIYGGGFSARHPTPEQLAEFALTTNEA